MAIYSTPFFGDVLSPFKPSHNNMRRFHRAIADREGGASPVMKPNYSYERDGTGLHLELEMPGVNKEDIVIEVLGKKLMVKGKRFRKTPDVPKKATAKDDADKDMKVAAKPSLFLVYAFEAQLGSEVELDAVQAVHAGNGILRLHMPRKADPGTRHIKINS